MEPSSFLSSYTGFSSFDPSSFAISNMSPGTMKLLGMGPLDLNNDKVLNRQVKSNLEKDNNKKIDLSDYTDLFNKDKKGEGKRSVLDDIIGDILDKNKKNKEGEGIDYEKMTGYAKSVIGEIDKVAQKARDRDFLREGIRSFANFPLIGAQANLEAAKNIADLTALNMGAMAAQNRVLETNPTKQKIAGKYFR